MVSYVHFLIKTTILCITQFNHQNLKFHYCQVVLVVILHNLTVIYYFNLHLWETRTQNKGISQNVML